MPDPIAFLVGRSNDSGVKQLITAEEKDLKKCSYFVGLLRSPFCPPQPILINDISPPIFRAVLEYLSTGSLSPTTVASVNLKDLVEAADFYLLDDLVKITLSHVSPVNIWQVLEWLLESQHSKLASLCKQVLEEYTLECLHQKGFLQASSACLRFLLELDNLNLSYEFELVQYCTTWASDKTDPRKAFRKVLNLLRLLELTPEQLGRLPHQFFTTGELQELWMRKINCGPTENTTPGLCYSLKKRNFRQALIKRVDKQTGVIEEHILTLVPYSMYKKQASELVPKERCHKRIIRNCLSIRPDIDVNLTRISLVPLLNIQDLVNLDSKLNSYVSAQKETDKQEENIKVMVYREFAKGYKTYYCAANCESGSHINFKSSELLKKGELARFEFILECLTPFDFRQINCQEVNNDIKKHLDCKVFTDVHVSVYTNEPIFLKSINFCFVH